VESTIMEGGYSTAEFVSKNQSALNTVQDVLNLALMIETQALDLYVRVADKTNDQDTRHFFYGMAKEEKAHLKMLGEFSQPQHSSAS
jgi:rubrerythrin